MIRTNLLASSAIALLTSLTVAQAQSTMQAQTQVAPAQNTIPAPGPASGVSQHATPLSGRAASEPAAQPRGTDTPQVQAVSTPPTRISTAVSISDTQRTKISQILMSARGTATSVAFPLTADTSVPNAVRLETVPPEVVAVASEYRGKSYFVTPDAIVIVNPANREIVSAFSFSDNEKALVPVVSREVVVLSTEQREAIRREVAPGASVGPAPLVRPRTVAVGDVAPGSIALEEFPPAVANDIPAVRSYRFYRSGQEVVIVNPSDRHVLGVID